MPNLVFVKLGPLTRQVSRLADAGERIAKALETMLAQVYGVAATQPAAEEKVAGEADVSYSTNEESIVREAEDELIRMGYRPPKDEE